SVGGSFAINKYINDSEATIGAGAQVNQDTDPRFHEGVQTVTVAANTEMNLIHVAGVGSLGFNIEGIAGAKEAVSETIKKNLGRKDQLLAGAKSLLNPFGAEGEKGGIGASFLIQDITNTTDASIQAGAQVSAGGEGTRWSRTFDPTKPGVVSDNWINFTDNTDRSTGDAVVYHVGPGGTAIGGLKDGATYYVIADPNNPKRFQLADSLEHASHGVALALDPSQAAGTQHQFGDTGVAVNAATRAFDFAFGQAGGQASTFGLAGAFTVALVNNTTHAHVDPGAVIESDSAVGVQALDESTHIAITGAVTAAANLGVGVSLGLN